MASCTKLEPVQIVYTDENDQIVCNNILEEILLKDDLKDKRVCVVSITGTFRQGKSFILNFFLRYLNIKYKHNRDVTNWLNSDEGPLSGFQWKSSYQAVTMGIMMWPEVFLGKLPSGEEVAIILLDTQGTFDNETSIKTCGKIFALSSLISSLQMYNLKEGIKQYDLSHLQIFADFGELLQSNSQDTHAPFQSILFLIRDWQNSHEFPYGKDGGHEYLWKQLRTKGQSEDLITLKDKIKELFGNIICFLLPYPGMAVARSGQFQGNIMDIEKDFIDHVETLVPTILAPENLVIKSISGQEVTVSRLCDLIKNYCNMCQDHSLPELQSMHEATMTMQHIAAVEESTIVFQDHMKLVQDSNAISAADLKVKYFEATKKARSYYSDKKKMGNLKLHKKYEKELLKKLEDQSAKYDQLNKMKRELEERNKKQEQEAKLKDISEKLFDLNQVLRNKKCTIL